MAPSCSINPRWKYDVFLSFRGEDTRENFTDHLYTALTERGIHTFRDDEEIRRGSKIAPEILKAIEESRFCVVVFSEGYSHSRWCLDELVKIIECVKVNGQTIIPIFYHVDPSDVRKPTGSFDEAFVNLGKQKEEKAKKWRAALREAGNISGWHLKHGYESMLIKKIANDIHKQLNCKILHVGENIVGMDLHLDRLRSLINIESNEVRMIGIYGIGGIGKSTIAKAICNSLSYHFDGISFLENVRDTTNYYGLLQLQKNILHDILKGRYMNVCNVGEGVNMIKDRLRSKRVLIVVDDVDKLCQLECTVGKHDWFCPGSRIIITTRDKHLLDVHRVDDTYEPKELDYEESIELFSRYAFKENLPKDEYKNFLNRAVVCAKGLPLALKVLGNFLFNRTIPEWESSLCKLEKKLHSEIQNVLQISFDGLDDTEKEIFLHIACFFKGKDKDFVSRILDGCDLYVESGIRVLVDKCLLTVSNNKLDMNDLLQHMGWDIVRNECLKEPGRRSRLWEGEDVYHVMTKRTGTEAIEGIFLDMSILKQMQFTMKAFKRMKRLRLLKIHQDDLYDCIVKYSKHVHILKVDLLGDFTFPSHDLRYLHWDGYPLKSLPSSFYAKHLVELSLQSSSIKKLIWDNKVFEKLKVLNVSYSQHLTKIPNFSSMPNLEVLVVKGCSKLESIPAGMYKLKHLKTLCCTGCSKLRAFPEIMDVMEDLREVYLDRTGIKNLPSSIVHLKGIQYLNLAHCEELETLPESICNLQSLKILLTHNCSKLCTFPGTLKSSVGFKPQSPIRHPELGLKPRRRSSRISLPEELLELDDLEELLELDDLEELEELEELLQPDHYYRKAVNEESKLPQLGNEDSKLPRLGNEEPKLPQVGNDDHELPQGIQEPKLPRVGNQEPKLPQVRNEEPKLPQVGNEDHEISQVGNKEPKLPQVENEETELPQQGNQEPELLRVGNLQPEFSQLVSLKLEFSQLIRSLQSENPIPKNLPMGSPRSYCEDRIKNTILMGGCSLYGLEELDLSYCNLKEGGVANYIFHLPSLQVLNLSGNHFCYIPLAIINLSQLRILKMSHCKRLRTMPMLPSSLREIDAHGCPYLLLLNGQTNLLQSLLNCFKSDIQDFEDGFDSSDRVIPGSLYDGKGISLLIDSSREHPSWIKHQNLGNEVIIRLPLNWHEDNDLLGFSLFSVHKPFNRCEEQSKDELKGENPPPCSLKCELSFLDEQFGIVDDLFWDSFCGCYTKDGAPDTMWVTYYPKTAIKDMYHSNKHTLLKASFRGTHFKVQMCGIDLIYAKDEGLNHHPMFIDSFGHFDDKASAAESTRIHNAKIRNYDAEGNSAEH